MKFSRWLFSFSFLGAAVSSPVVLDLHPPMDHHQAEEQVLQLVERFLPQRRSPGQRSQDSGFSGYSGDSASEGSSGSGSNSNNNSPLPVPAASGSPPPVPIKTNKRSPLVDSDAAEKALAAPSSLQPLETDLDATPSRCMRSHVSRIYIGTSAIAGGSHSDAAVLAANLRDVLQCEKNYIQPVNLSPASSGSGSNTSPDKCVGDKSLIGAVLASSRLNNNNRSDSPVSSADRSGDSQTALLLEHKSIVSAPPASINSLRPNLSWKKLSESFRRVISTGRMMAAGSTSPHSCIASADQDAAQDNDDDEGDQSFTDEEKTRMLFLAKRSNLRRLHLQQENPTQPDEETNGSCINRFVGKLPGIKEIFFPLNSLRSESAVEQTIRRCRVSVWRLCWHRVYFSSRDLWLLRDSFDNQTTTTVLWKKKQGHGDDGEPKADEPLPGRSEEFDAAEIHVAPGDGSSIQ